MRKLRFRKVKCLVQRHTAIKWLWLKPSFIRFQSSCFSLSYLVLICTRGPGHKELEYGQTANYGDSGKLWGGPQRETSNKKCESPQSCGLHPGWHQQHSGSPPVWQRCPQAQPCDCQALTPYSCIWMSSLWIRHGREQTPDHCNAVVLFPVVPLRGPGLAELVTPWCWESVLYSANYPVSFIFCVLQTQTPRISRLRN